MNILGMSQEHSGCGYHRVVLPLGFMDDVTGYVTNVVTEDKFEGNDILLFNRLSQFDSDWPQTKKLMGAKVVMDIDDYWHLPPSHINHRGYELFSGRIEDNLRAADLVTVTNEALLRKVLPFNLNAIILPNALPFGRNQFTDERAPATDDLVRIFWAGGATHARDIELLRGPFKKLDRRKVKMVLGGYTDGDPASKAIWSRMFSAFTAGGTLHWTKLHGTGPSNYMDMYRFADIVVVPLERSDWHACKSNLKLLEAATKRLPVIVSNVAPYNVDSDAPVLWVNKQTDWTEHLNFLINNAGARAEYGQRLYEWAKEKFDLTEINKTRRSAYAGLLGTR